MFPHLMKKVANYLARKQYAPKIEVTHSLKPLRLGSDYGGWTFEPSDDLQNSVIVSAGLGEDGSFDVEFASKFNATVVIVDPTPRAIFHFEAIRKHIGEPARIPYVKGGKLPVGSYDLRKITENSLHLEQSALWIEQTTLKFFSPPDPHHVSYSINNFQNGHSQGTSYIEVPSVTLEQLLNKYGLKSLPLIKLDIEGAEIEVIRNMLNGPIRPRQILVEFHSTSLKSKSDVEDLDRALRRSGYLCRHFDGVANALYARR